MASRSIVLAPGSCKVLPAIIPNIVEKVCIIPLDPIEPGGSAVIEQPLPDEFLDESRVFIPLATLLTDRAGNRIALSVAKAPKKVVVFCENLSPVGSTPSSILLYLRLL